jgi:hypothetical protein
MNPLTASDQLILHSPDGHPHNANWTGGFVCDRWSGLPSSQPAMISLVPADQTPKAVQHAQDLAQEMSRVLRRISSTAQTQPCRTGQVIVTCRGHKQPANTCVLVIVGDATGYQDYSGAVSLWTQAMTHDPRYRMVVICPNRDVMLSHLPPPLRKLNLLEWCTGPADAVPAVMGLARVTTSDFRVFISYFRKDGEDHADDIFNTLTHAGYDVFLDRVDIRPGADISDRIREEILHKGVLLVLETPQAMNSKWIRDEVAIARSNRLSILAAQFPNSSPVASISKNRRYNLLEPKDYNHGKLTKAGLQEILHHVTDRQILWFARKRFQLQRALDLGLTHRGLVNHRVLNGIVDVVPNWTDQRPRSIQVTPRMAELEDFQLMDGALAPSGTWKQAVLAPGRFAPGQRQANLLWLSGKLKTAMWDEGNMKLLIDRLDDSGKKDLE